MLFRSVLIAGLLTVASVAWAQQKSQRQSSGLAPNSSTDCAATFSSGTFDNATTYCVTKNGNIVQFSRAGEEFIRVGDFAEGYGICDIDTNFRYYDYAVVDSDNWLDATFSSNATKAISTRVTKDGVWQITNTISKTPANASGPGSAKVSMQIRNLTGVDRQIVILRYADVDFSSDGVDDYNNDFDFTAQTASGLEPAGHGGLSLTNNTFAYLHVAFAQSLSSGPDPCEALGSYAPQPFVGDGSVVQAYGLVVPKNATKTIAVTYKPI